MRAERKRFLSPMTIYVEPAGLQLERRRAISSAELVLLGLRDNAGAVRLPGQHVERTAIAVDGPLAVRTVQHRHTTAGRLGRLDRRLRMSHGHGLESGLRAARHTDTIGEVGASFGESSTG